jgi:non-ribosomal peptide synthetase component F
VPDQQIEPSTSAAVHVVDVPPDRAARLPDPERHRVAGEWNDTGRDVEPATFPELFDAQVARTPDLPALLADGAAITYAELAVRADRLAHLLIERGAGPERIVALALPRSVEIVVAQLAVLKAGASFLPVDPAYPVDRIGFMLADARPVLVLTRSDVAATLPGVGDVPVLVLDDAALGSEMESMPDRPPVDADRSLRCCWSTRPT